MTEQENQRPHTAEQIAALPEGPRYGFEEHEYTEQDRQNGFITVRGKRINVVVGCSKVMIPIAPNVVAFYSDEADVLGYIDASGICWTLGLYADGKWFRRPS